MAPLHAQFHIDAVHMCPRAIRSFPDILGVEYQGTFSTVLDPLFLASK